MRRLLFILFIFGCGLLIFNTSKIKADINIINLHRRAKQNKQQILDI